MLDDSVSCREKSCVYALWQVDSVRGMVHHVGSAKVALRVFLFGGFACP
jgi:hypothetical protein